MRILYTTTIGLTMIFFKSFIKQLIDEGHTVDIATNDDTYSVDKCYKEWGCKIYPISLSRSPLSAGNIKAVKELKKLIVDNNYDIVHCHTPIAATCTRIVCKGLRKNGLKVIYTAHGFHFYKGAPIQNWVLFYPMEKLCARWTDTLITINKEDYTLAQKRMKAKSVEYIPGVGIDTEKFKNTVVDKNAKRVEIGVPKDAFLILSVGELNENKNHQIVIKAIAELKNKNIHYVIAGKGDQKDALERLAAELGIEKQFHLLGYRNDVAELYKTADVYALPSIREGLNVSVMEALASGLPCIVSKIRGNVDMVDETNGYLASTNDVGSELVGIKDILSHQREHAKCMVSAEKYNITIINQKLSSIYAEVVNE